MSAQLVELIRSLDDDDWKMDAACREKPPSWFFPERGQNTRLAQAVCRKCPVFDTCDEYANQTGSSGFWAGRMREGRGSSSPSFL